MNFLLKLIFAAGIAGPLVAAPYENGLKVPSGTDSVHVESMAGADLNHSYTIKNPYAESADKPFTIAAAVPTESPAPFAEAKVTCGNRTWENNQLLGHTGDGKYVKVRIQDNRIYLNWNGEVSGNIWILYYLQEGVFHDNYEDGQTIANCVNPVDPSTVPNSLLGKTNDGKITCNGIVMPEGDLLGTYVATEGETRQFIRTVNGMLRIAIKQGPNDTRENNYNMSLMNFTIRGANGSYMAPKWRNVLTEDMVNGCFWPIEPKPATPVVETNCPSGPTVKTVTNVSQTSLRFTYEGTGVSSIKWKILSGTNTVANGTTGNLGSTTVNLTFGTLIAGNYKLAIEGSNCLSASSEMSFTVPVPPVGNCIAGPNLQTVTNITATGLRFTFDGLGVNTIKWKILSGTSTVANGTTAQLTSSTVNLTFGSLAAGTYKLAIEGGDCISSPSELSFTVAGATNPNCASGPTLRNVTNISATGLQFSFDGVGVSTVKWKILSGTSTVANGTTGNLSGTTATLSFASLSAGNYKLVIEGGNCTSSTSEMNFTVPAPPVGNCIAGPTVQTVTNISTTGLRFTFDGLGVHTIKWKILSGTSTVANATTGELTSAAVNITYAALAPGSYKLVIEGGDCTSAQSEMTFTVPGSTPDCGSGPTLQTISNISATGLRFTYAGTGVTKIKWKVLSGVSTVASGTTGTLTGTTVNLTFASLAQGTYKLAIEGSNCVSGQNEMNFTVPAPPIPNCASGPTIKTLTNITATSLRFTFDGIGISTIKWKVLSGSTTVASGTTGTLSSSTVNLTFASLSPGTYKLAIEGGSCVSTLSEMNFTVPTPPVANCASGPTLQTVTNITATGLRFTFSGVGITTIKWKILSGVTNVANGTTGTISGTTVDLTFGSLSSGTYKLAIEGGNCTSSQNEMSFTVPVPTLEPCVFGPSLLSLSEPSSTSLKFSFNGINVTAIDWKIMKGNTMMRSNRVAPQSSTPQIDYAKLSDGEYTLQIQGGSCTSAVTSAKFKVGTSLPIYIANFKGEVVDKGVELSWEVVAEEDGKEFEVLRYDDKLKKEEVLGKVSLTDQRVGWYHFTDEKPLLGINYYQLKQIDIDGTFEKSKMISINPGIITGRIAAPNPASEYVDVQFTSRTSGLSNVSIYTVSGVEVSSSQIQITEGNNNHRLNVKKLINGSYIIKISHGGEASKLRFMKVN